MNTPMKNLSKLSLIAVTLGLAGTSLAGPRPHHVLPAPQYEYARVVASTPVYEEFNQPRQECWTEQVSYQEPVRDRNYGGAILGGIVGGIVGNQVGKGTGKTIATAVGAATGAMVGDNVGNRGHDDSFTRVGDVQRCRTVDQWSRRVIGYDVIYRYGGQQYNAFLPYDPGHSVRLKIQVSVAER